MSKKKSIRSIVRTLHLWLGLPTGVVVMIVALTGAIYALKPEVERIGRPDLSTKERTGQVMSPRELMEQVRPLVYRTPADSSNAIYGVTYYGEQRAAVVGARVGSSRHSRYFLNPFTGELLHEEHSDYDLWRWAMDGHRRLWLPREIGKPIVGGSVLIFILVTLTGLVLWVPQRWSRGRGLKEALTLKWSAGGYRRWYSVHNVLGFYTAICALAMAITGLTWSFDWWRRGYYTAVTGGGRLVEWRVPESIAVIESPYQNPDSSIWEIARAEYPLKDDGSSLRVDMPLDSLGVYTINYNPDGDLAYGRSSYHFYDRYTLNEVPGGGVYGVPRERLSWGRKLYRMTYDIHSGSVFGTVGRYLAFVVSLIVASLPVTGVYLWWRRRPSR